MYFKYVEFLLTKSNITNNMDTVNERKEKVKHEIKHTQL